MAQCVTIKLVKESVKDVLVIMATKHEIYITVSTTYGLAKRLQQENYPFNQLFGHFIDQVALLAEHLGYDLPTTLGYIERSTCYNMEPTFGSTRSKESFQARISVKSDYLTNLYENSPYNHKTSMSLLFRTLISMARIYGTSMVQLSYLVRSLNEGDLSMKPRKSSPKKAKTKRKSTKESETVKDVVKPTRPVLRKPHLSEEPAVVEVPDPTVVEVPESTVVEPSVHVEVSEPSVVEQSVVEPEVVRDPQLDRATALLNKAKSLTEGSNVGKTVKTNPHLGDFF